MDSRGSSVALGYKYRARLLPRPMSMSMTWLCRRDGNAFHRRRYIAGTPDRRLRRIAAQLADRRRSIVRRED